LKEKSSNSSAVCSAIVGFRENGHNSTLMGTTRHLGMYMLLCLISDSGTIIYLQRKQPKKLLILFHANEHCILANRQSGLLSPFV
jgi:hypothetical protein